jgi:hypothetical protein
MHKLSIPPTRITPEVYFSPDENIYIIRGNSAPEDVRKMYYPVLEWLRDFVSELTESKTKRFSFGNPFKLKVDLDYFNSSSAKFLYDIFSELKRLDTASVPFNIEWYYDVEDEDMKEAGYDISLLANMNFDYIAKHR